MPPGEVRVRAGEPTCDADVRLPAGEVGHVHEGVVEGGVEVADCEDVLVLRAGAQGAVVGDLFFFGFLFLFVFLSLGLLLFGLKQLGQRASRSYHFCFRSNLI